MNYFLLFLTALFIIFQKVCQDRYNAKRDSGVFFFSGMISFFAMCFFMAVNRNWVWSNELIIPAIAFGLSYAAATVFVVLAIKCGSLAKTTLTDDISWFCKKFDYRYDAEPWYNSKDAVERAIKFIRSDIHNK